MNRKHLLLMGILVSSLTWFFSNPATASSVHSLQTAALHLPFEGPWYICQGYNNSISHYGKDIHGLDLSTDKDSYSGTSGCNIKTKDAAASRPVYAPADGKIEKYDGLYKDNLDLIYYKINTGGCLVIGHVVHDETNFPVGPYKSGEVIGKVSGPNKSNNQIAHIHLSIFEKDCYHGDSIPFDSTYGFELIGLNQIYDLPSDGTSNQYRKWALVGLGENRESPGYETWLDQQQEKLETEINRAVEEKQEELEAALSSWIERQTEQLLRRMEVELERQLNEICGSAALPLALIFSAYFSKANRKRNKRNSPDFDGM